MSALQLRPLRLEDEKSFKEAVREFARESPPWPFAFSFDPAAPFSQYLELLDGWSKGDPVPENFVQVSYNVGIVDGRVVGRVSLRHELNDYLRRNGGHIGFGVVPSHRKRGHATAMLRQTLPICAEMGIGQALVTCDEGNAGSRKVIETCGGIVE